MSEYAFSFYFALFFAGACGASLRYGVDRLLHQIWSASFPFGILAVNLSGAFIVGWPVAAAFSGWIDDPVYVVMSIGFTGSYTTFSSWMVKSMELFLDGNHKAALSNLLLTLVPGWLLTLSGLWFGIHFIFT